MSRRGETGSSSAICRSSSWWSRPSKAGRRVEQLVECHAERINVGPLVDDAAPGQGLLRAHVAESPDHVAGVRQTEIAGKARQAEIGDPERAVVVDQEVGRLDIAMEDPQAMCVVECVGRLNAQSGDVVGKKPDPGASPRAP